MRRFYKDVAVVGAPGGFLITLDEKPMRSPASRDFVLPTRALADAIAAEWQAQEKNIEPHTMPFMQLAATAVDHVALMQADMQERLLAYLDSELVCLRAQGPEELVKLQCVFWQPPLDWFNARYDVHLEPSNGLKGAPVSAACRERLALVLAAFTPWQFIGVQTAALAAGSLVLGLSLYEGAMKADDIYAAAELEATYQNEKWGEDNEAQARRMALKRELRDVALWFKLIASEMPA